MPLIVNNFKWRQTETVVIINVPLHGIHQSKVDIFKSPKYLKASYERYFFEVLLLHDVNISSSSCTISETQIVFELLKNEKIPWEQLEMNVTKKEKLEIKQQIIDEEYQRFRKECESKQNKKHELKRVAVHEQIVLDTNQRNLIENIKNDEKDKALSNLEQWYEESTHKAKIIELSSDEEDDIKPERPRTQNKIIAKAKNLHNTKYQQKSSRNVPMPLPRKAVILKVDFTPREFPTPSRESRLEEENEWLQKQTAARRSVGFASEDLRAEEKNPQYLKSKGDEFLKAKNYLAAVSAYSFGLKLSENFTDLYVGRIHAHFALGNWHKTIQDCSKALELMKPEVSANLEDRVTCITHRGLALCKIGMKSQGITELEASLRLQPMNDHIKQELEKVRLELSEDD